LGFVILAHEYLFSFVPVDKGEASAPAHQIARFIARFFVLSAATCQARCATAQ
jgi:hypothetical protein